MKSVLTALLLICFNATLFSQDFDVVADSSKTNEAPKEETQKPKKEKVAKEKKGFDPSNIMFGGGLGLSFTNGGGMVNVAPIVGYRFNKHLQAAFKFSYWYAWGESQTPTLDIQKVNDHMYTASVLGRVVVFKGLYVHVEPEYMNRGQYAWVPSGGGWNWTETGRIDVFNMYLGPGFYQGFNGKGGVFIQVLWNLNDSPNSFYSNPFMQVGVIF